MAQWEAGEACGGDKTQKLVSTVIKEEWLVGIYGGWLLTSWQELSGGRLNYSHGESHHGHFDGGYRPQ